MSAERRQTTWTGDRRPVPGDGPLAADGKQWAHTYANTLRNYRNTIISGCAASNACIVSESKCFLGSVYARAIVTTQQHHALSLFCPLVYMFLHLQSCVGYDSELTDHLSCK